MLPNNKIASVPFRLLIHDQEIGVLYGQIIQGQYIKTLKYYLNVQIIGLIELACLNILPENP